MHKNVEGNAQRKTMQLIFLNVSPLKIKVFFYLSVGLLQIYTAQWTDLYETFRRDVFLAKE